MARIRNTRGFDEPQRIVWNIAAYIRISREDGNDESLSVTNQKKIILEYLELFFRMSLSLWTFIWTMA